MNSRSLFQQLIIEILKFNLALLFLGIDPALTNMKGIISSSYVTLIAYVIANIFYLFVTFFKNICKPLKIIIEIQNNVTAAKETLVFAHSINTESERTVKLRIYMKKTRSIFSWVAMRLVCGKLCYLDINTVPRDYFTLIPETNNMIIKNQYGFKINLTEIFNQLLNIPDGFIDREFTFVVAKSRDVEINNKCEVEIVPQYIINDKLAGFLHFLIYDVNIDKHHIKFFINYNGFRLPA